MFSGRHLMVSGRECSDNVTPTTIVVNGGITDRVI